MPAFNVAAMNGYLAQMRAEGLPIVPTLANVNAQGNWATQQVATMLHHPAMMTQQVAEIVALVQRQRYAGIDIDYENLQAQ